VREKVESSEENGEILEEGSGEIFDENKKFSEKENDEVLNEDNESPKKIMTKSKMNRRSIQRKEQ
jgi:hypothetical protein